MCPGFHEEAILFPFLFGGTFIEGIKSGLWNSPLASFPFLFGGTFIEGHGRLLPWPFGLLISLPFRRDFR